MSVDQGRRLGWIGVGRMGRVLATRLLEAGHDLAVYNRTREKCAPLAEMGATVVDAPADLADCEIVFTIVAGSADVEEVIAGPRGLLSGREDAWLMAEPYLEQLARTVVYVGDGERARLVKICHNLMLGVVAQCMAEVTVLA